MPRPRFNNWKFRGERKPGDFVVGRHHPEQGVPGRPTGALPESVDEQGRYGGLDTVHGGERGDAEALHDHGHENDFPGADPVDERTRQRAHGKRQDRHSPDEKTRYPERNVPDLVQIDDEKGKGQPSPD